MKAMAYLQKIESMNEKINTDLEDLAQLRSLATKTTTVMGGEKVQSSGSQQKMADCVVKILALQDEIADEIDRFIDFKNEAKKLIHSACDADCIKLLHKRYFGELNQETDEIEYKTWEKIAVEMGYTYQWVSDGLHKRALAQLQKALDEKNAKKNSAVDIS